MNLQNKKSKAPITISGSSSSTKSKTMILKTAKKSKKIVSKKTINPIKTNGPNNQIKSKNTMNKENLDQQEQKTILLNSGKIQEENTKTSRSKTTDDNDNQKSIKNNFDKISKTSKTTAQMMDDKTQFITLLKTRSQMKNSGKNFNTNDTSVKTLKFAKTKFQLPPQSQSPKSLLMSKEKKSTKMKTKNDTTTMISKKKMDDFSGILKSSKLSKSKANSTKVKTKRSKSTSKIITRKEKKSKTKKTGSKWKSTTKKSSFTVEKTEMEKTLTPIGVSVTTTISPATTTISPAKELPTKASVLNAGSLATMTNNDGGSPTSTTSLSLIDSKTIQESSNISSITAPLSLAKESSLKIQKESENLTDTQKFMEITEKFTDRKSDKKLERKSQERISPSTSESIVKSQSSMKHRSSKEMSEKEKSNISVQKNVTKTPKSSMILDNISVSSTTNVVINSIFYRCPGSYQEIDEDDDLKVRFNPFLSGIAFYPRHDPKELDKMVDVKHGAPQSMSNSNLFSPQGSATMIVMESKPKSKKSLSNKKTATTTSTIISPKIVEKTREIMIEASINDGTNSETIQSTKSLNQISNNTSSSSSSSSSDSGSSSMKILTGKNTNEQQSNKSKSKNKGKTKITIKNGDQTTTATMVTKKKKDGKSSNKKSINSKSTNKSVSTSKKKK